MGILEEVQVVCDVLMLLIFGIFLFLLNVYFDLIVQLEIVWDLIEMCQDFDLIEEEWMMWIVEFEECLVQVEVGNFGLVSLLDDVNVFIDDGGIVFEEVLVLSVLGQVVVVFLGMGLLLMVLFYVIVLCGFGFCILLVECLVNVGIVVGIVVVLVWSFGLVDMDCVYLLVENVGDMGEFFVGFFLIDIMDVMFCVDYWLELFVGIFEVML